MRFSATAVGLVLAAGVAIATPFAAAAEGLKLSGSTKSRASLLKSQMALLDGRLAVQYDASVRLTPNGKKAGEGRLQQTQPMAFSLDDCAELRARLAHVAVAVDEGARLAEHHDDALVDASTVSATIRVGFHGLVRNAAVSLPFGGPWQRLEGATSPASSSCRNPREFARVNGVSRARIRSNSALPPTWPTQRTR